MASAEDMEPEDPGTPTRTNKCDYDVDFNITKSIG